MNLLVSMSIALGLTIMFIIIIFIISLWLEKNSREASSAFECGIESFSSSRNPFSIRFFLFMVLFIIFDMEILLLIHFPFSWKYNMLLNNFFVFIPFSLMISVLLIGTFFEKKQGALCWQEFSRNIFSCVSFTKKKSALRLNLRFRYGWTNLSELYISWKY